MVDGLARAQGVKLDKLQEGAAVARCSVAGRRVVLAKPMTFMNNSGGPVRKLVNFYKVRSVTGHIMVTAVRLPRSLGRTDATPPSSQETQRSWFEACFVVSRELCSARVHADRMLEPSYFSSGLVATGQVATSSTTLQDQPLNDVPVWTLASIAIVQGFPHGRPFGLAGPRNYQQRCKAHVGSMC